MKRFIVVTACLFVILGVHAEEFPSLEERQATHQELTARRDAIEFAYKEALKTCYQNFDVNACRYEARERRIAQSKALQPEELAYRAMERRIQADETRQRLAEKNDEAKQKEVDAQRAQVLEERRQHASQAEQKQLDHELKGTHRGAYDERLRQAQEHRDSVEKRLRERNKEPAAPLPVPGTSR